MTLIKILKTFKQLLKEKNIFYQVWENPNSNSKYILIEYGLGDIIRISDKPTDKRECKYYIGSYIKKNSKNGRYFFHKPTLERVKKICHRIYHDQRNRMLSKGKEKYKKEMKELLVKQKQNKNKFFTVENCKDNFPYDLFSFEEENDRIDLFSRLRVGEIKNRLLNKLEKEDFYIQKYESYSSESIYLKFDFGVANSLRISDHKGKHYLKYHYNIGTHIKEKREENQDGYKRYYYPNTLKGLNQLVKDIKKERLEKIKKYGKEKYIEYVKENYRKGKMKKSSFWQQAKIIQKW